MVHDATAWSDVAPSDDVKAPEHNNNQPARARGCATDSVLRSGKDKEEKDNVILLLLILRCYV